MSHDPERDKRTVDETACFAAVLVIMLMLVVLCNLAQVEL